MSRRVYQGGLNPGAVAFWLFSTAIGGLVGGIDGALGALAVSASISFLLSFVR